MMHKISLYNVTKTYLKGKLEIEAVSNLNLTINEGEFVVINGKSGSGKSTLLSLISGLQPPSSGRIKIDDVDITEMSNDDLDRFRRSQFGIIFQDFKLIPYLNVLENIRIPLYCAEISTDTVQIDDIIERLKLDHRREHFPNDLSGGEKQRVGIVRAVVHNPDILIADEPTGNLNNLLSQQIIDYLFKLQVENSKLFGTDTKKTIILVSHDKNIIRRGMRVIELGDGRIENDYFA